MVLEQVVFSGFFIDELVAKIWVRIGLSFFCLCVRNNNGRLNIWFFYESRRFAIARLTTTPDLLKPSLVYHFNSAAHGYWFFLFTQIMTLYHHASSRSHAHRAHWHSSGPHHAQCSWWIAMQYFPISRILLTIKFSYCTFHSAFVPKRMSVFFPIRHLSLAKHQILTFSTVTFGITWLELQCSFFNH